jgi:hypothetical protein
MCVFLPYNKCENAENNFFLKGTEGSHGFRDYLFYDGPLLCLVILAQQIPVCAIEVAVLLLELIPLRAVVLWILRPVVFQCAESGI